jgi:hypothetical protein
MAQPSTALLVTYTMEDPAAVGVFFRALRLARELRRRGWSSVVFNYGPIPDDPKVDEIRRHGEIISFDSDNPWRDLHLILATYRRIEPRVVLFGEYPLEFMEPLLFAARLLVAPPILMLDQHYGTNPGTVPWGVDGYLLYGVRSLWREPPVNDRSIAIIPPFIDAVTPKHELPVPAGLAARPWVTIVGFDRRVLSAGIELLARLRDLDVAGIVLSHNPAEAGRLMREAALSDERAVALPLQEDANLFGLIAASSVVVLANGFMQLCEAIALGCPAVCVHRGIGMDAYTLHEVFRPYVAFVDSLDERTERARAWLRETPFTEECLSRLQGERGGAAAAADRAERAVAQPQWRPKMQRRRARWRRALNLDSPLRTPNVDAPA